MKNFMRRTVAFMLFACLLLSVMAPTAFAKTDNADGSVTYGPSDFTLVDKVNTVTMRNDRIVMNYMGYSDGNPYVSVKLGYSVEAGLYETTFSVNYRAAGTVVDAYVVAEADYNKDNIANLTPNSPEFVCTIGPDSGTTAAQTAYTSAGNHQYGTTGSYIYIFKPNTASASGDVWFLNLTLKSIPQGSQATVVTDYDFRDLFSVLNIASGEAGYFNTNYDITTAYSNGELNFMPYASATYNTSAVLVDNGKTGAEYIGITNQCSIGGFTAVKIPSPGVGTYTVDFTGLGKANMSDNVQVIFFPISAVTAKLAADANATEATAIAALIADGGYTVAANGKMYENGGVATPGTVEITSDEEYIVVFYAEQNKSGQTADQNPSEQRSWMCLYGFTMTQDIDTLDSASLAGTTQFSTVTLNENVTVDTLNIGTGATLDLNGMTVTGNVNVTDGNLIDSSNVAGSISGTVNVASGNDALPLMDGNVYRLYSVTKKANGYTETTDGVNFYFDLDMPENVYAMVKAGGFNISAQLTIGGTEIDEIVNINTAVNQWLDANGVYTDANTTDGDGCLWIQLTGLQGLAAGTQIVVTPIFENVNTGVSGMFGGAITYTIPAAAE